MAKLPQHPPAEPIIADGQTALELLSDPHHARGNAILITARIKDGSLVDTEMIRSIMKAALQQAVIWSDDLGDKSRSFVRMMNVIQAQQKIEQTQMKIELAERAAEQKQPSAPPLHFHAHASSDPRRTGLTALFARFGIPEVADAYFAEG